MAQHPFITTKGTNSTIPPSKTVTSTSTAPTGWGRFDTQSVTPRTNTATTFQRAPVTNVPVQRYNTQVIAPRVPQQPANPRTNVMYNAPSVHYNNSAPTYSRSVSAPASAPSVSRAQTASNHTKHGQN